LKNEIIKREDSKGQLCEDAYGSQLECCYS
jgi:hypothetical protein